MSAPRRRLVAVVGDGAAREDEPRYAAARELGRLLVDAGHRVVTGGLGGVMEAACRGAHESQSYVEGATVGLLPGLSAADANPWVDVALPTGLGHLRNALVAQAGDAVIVVGGGAGTLAEMAFAWIHDRPIVALEPCGGWGATLSGTPVDARDRGLGPGDGVHAAQDAAEAVAQVRALLPPEAD